MPAPSWHPPSYTDWRHLGAQGNTGTVSSGVGKSPLPRIPPRGAGGAGGREPGGRGAELGEGDAGALSPRNREDIGGLGGFGEFEPSSNRTERKKVPTYLGGGYERRAPSHPHPLLTSGGGGGQLGVSSSLPELTLGRGPSGVATKAPRVFAVDHGGRVAAGHKQTAAATGSSHSLASTTLTSGGGPIGRREPKAGPRQHDLI